MKLLKRFRSDEGGFVMVTAVIVMGIALTVAAVAIDDTVTARSVVTKDARVHAAQQAADTGVQLQLYRANQKKLGNFNFNGGLAGLSSTFLCRVPVTVNGEVTSIVNASLAADGTCPTRPPADPGGKTDWVYEKLGNRTQVATRFIPGQKSNTGGHVSLNPVIVSVGRETKGTTTTSDDVVRRVEAILNPVDPFQLIEATGNLTFNALLATTVNGDIRTNGKLDVNGLALVGGNVLSSDGPLLRLANAQYKTYEGLLTIADHHPTNDEFVREPVSIHPDKPKCWNGSGAQGSAGACPAAQFLEGANNYRLRLEPGESLTLGGGDYVFCSVSIATGATLQTSVSATSPTRIFIDNPNSSRCTGGHNGELALNGNLNTVNLSPSVLQFYMAGNGTPGGTNANIDTTWTTTLTPAFFLYAPDTNVTMRFRLFKGNIIGHDVTMNAACTIGLLGLCLAGADVITQDLNLYNMPLNPAVGVFTQKQYVQCSGYEPPVATPTKDC